MILSIIVAASENNAIGKNNQLLWNLPEDLKFFKNTTWGLPLIMGRKTFEAVGSKPLPGRFNIIVTRDKNFKPADASVRVANSIEKAIELARDTDCNEIFISGGAEIYKQSMDLCNKIYMTRVKAVLDGDAWFPNIDPAKWEMTSAIDFPIDEKHAYAYSFQVWVKKQ